MWRIQENRNIEKICKKLPESVVRKYDLWKKIIFRNGPDMLKEFPGLHDEKLKGERVGERSSRLSQQYRGYLYRGTGYRNRLCSGNNAALSIRSTS